MTAISFNNVKKMFRNGFQKVTVLHGISLQVRHGEIFGFLGPNGAGKSTAIKLLLDFIKPDEGQMTVKGAQVGKEAYKHHIGYLPETPCFYENLTALETLRFAGGASGMSSKGIREASIKVLKQLSLEHASSQPIKTYSKGMKQRLGLAMSLIHDPLIYILDEPMSGLDPMGRRLVADVMLGLRENGKTVFFSSHILSDVETLCDRIGILNKGRLLFSGAVSEIKKEGSSLEEVFIDIIEKDERNGNE